MKKIAFAIAGAMLLSVFCSVARAETPRNFSAHFGMGTYSIANIDNEPGLNGKPMKSAFGESPKLNIEYGFEYIIWQKLGNIGIEGASGYWSDKGRGVTESGARSSDATRFKMVPFKLSAVYRFDYLMDKYAVPVVPSIKFGFDYFLWWVLNQRNGIARYTDKNGKKFEGLGGTFGLHVSYGLLFNLDYVDPTLARDFDNNVGVNNTYLYVEGVYSWVNDFGSKNSWDLSSHGFLAGILFEF